MGDNTRLCGLLDNGVWIFPFEGEDVVIAPASDAPTDNLPGEHLEGLREASDPEITEEEEVPDYVRHVLEALEREGG